MPTRYELVPDESQVWIEGNSSVHPIRATATGLSGWVELSLTKAGLRSGSKVSGEVRVEVDRLQSGNSLVDRETRRRIDATRFPEIVGRSISSQRLAPDRVGLDGDIEFRGMTSRVTGELSVSRADSTSAVSSTNSESGASLTDSDAILLEGAQGFDVRDWDLKPPRIGLLKVHPDIRVRVRLLARPA